VENIWKVLGFGFMLTVEQVIYFTVASVLLFTLSWKLAIVSLLTMPVIAYLAFNLEKKIEETYGKISDQVSVLNTTAQENIAGVRLVKAFGRERHEIQKFMDQNIVNYDLNVEQARVWSIYHPRIEFLSNVTVVLVTAIGGWLVIGEEMTVGTLVAFTNYIFMLIWPMRMLGWLTNLLSQCRASVKKLDILFHEVPTILNPENPKVPVEHMGHVVFENVSFSYNGVSVLKDITIDARPGSTVAIMGTTGSGKSSIVNLIGRFYDCESGSIKVDGVDVKEWDLLALRSQVSVVAQDTFLFSDSIEENIKFGSKDDNPDIWMAAAREAKVHDYVMEMNEGYETVIGERGVGLSGGQKQRISIARALAKNSKILILDDATSALDIETEYDIQKAVEDRRGMTKFIIAHRISAVKNADEILIIEDGEIVERGTHRGLLQKKGKYYDTYCAQFDAIMVEQNVNHARKRCATAAHVLQEEVV
jgi:ATP-binding cassette subfamily B multidrug efflux pump